MLNYLAVGADEILLFNQSFYKQYYNGGGEGVVMETGLPHGFAIPSRLGIHLFYIYTPRVLRFALCDKLEVCLLFF